MNPNREELIFALALTKAESERAAFLERECAGDLDLLQRVERLLAAHEKAGGFLDKPAAEPSTIVTGPVAEEAPGMRIGRYKLLEKIGEGGMGVVYMAEQQEPVRRRVALKIIKLGMDTRQVVARFEAERQALALMDHPNIAKVLDGGATESGRPYFVMELVRGVPITEYCDKNRLPTRPRLDLFVQVCHAIQHAHQKGVIHRDLKPTNILVTLNDGVPSPMVIDFGIAKATNQRLTEKTLFTNYATMIGTPAYMSPEQAEMSKLDVDTRTDIYSLGVLLYELLTGDTPFPSKNLLSVGYGEMQRIIAEQEPVRPSTRLSTMGHDERTVVARNRSLEASALGRLFRGDLDWIVMKCLEKDRTRRYETANGLAMDIGRYVLNEPVLACPPSAAYRFQKLIRRNRIAFAAGSLVIAALTLGLLASTWQAIRARKAELLQVRMREKADQALANEAREHQAAEAARIAERDQRKQADAIRYASDMSLAQQALKDGKFGRVWELLDRNRPAQGQDDLRGWEWRYLWQQSRPDEFIDLGHAEYMHGLALSRDRRWLAVAAHAGLSIRDISDLHAPHEIALLPTKPPGMVAFSPSENLLAYTSIEWESDKNPNTKLVLWNAETRTATATLTITDSCSSIVFSADGRTLATLSGTWDPSAHLELWQIPSGGLIASHALSPMHFIGGRNGKLALAPDLSWAAIAGRRLSIIDLSTAHERWGIDCDPDSNGGFNCLALSPDGKFLVSTGGRPASLPSMAVWDTASGQEIGQHGMDSRTPADQIAFSPDGSTLVSSGGADRAIRIWDSSDPTRMHLRGRSLRGHRSGAFFVVLARDGKTLITGSDDHSIYAWDIQHPPDEPTVATWTNIVEWAFGPGNDAVVTVAKDGEIAMSQGPEMATKTRLLKLEPDYEYVRLSGNGSWFAASYMGGVIKIWDLRRPGEPRQFTVDSKSPNLWGWSADGTKLLVHNGESQVAEWDVTKGRKLREWTVSRNELNVRMDNGWNRILMTKERPSDTLSIIEMTTGQRREVSSPLTRTLTINFSDDGSLFAAAGFLGYIRVWDTSSLREVCTLGGGQQAPHYSISFSPDRTRLLAGCMLGLSFRLYDLKSKQELISVPGGFNPTWDARFSPDGNLIGALCKFTLQVHRAPSLAKIDAVEAKQKSQNKYQ